MTSKTKLVSRENASQREGFAAAKLDELIEEATVDAYDESEQTTGFYTMFQEHLALPFKTEVLGVEVPRQHLSSPLRLRCAIPILLPRRSRTQEVQAE